MKINYENIMNMNKNGMTYKDIWKVLNLPIKYNTFESAVVNYKKTGKCREFIAVNNSYRYKPLEEDIPEMHYTSLDDLVKTIKRFENNSKVVIQPVIIMIS